MVQIEKPDERAGSNHLEEALKVVGDQTHQLVVMLDIVSKSNESYRYESPHGLGLTDGEMSTVSPQFGYLSVKVLTLTLQVLNKFIGGMLSYDGFSHTIIFIHVWGFSWDSGTALANIGTLLTCVHQLRYDA